MSFWSSFKANSNGYIYPICIERCDHGEGAFIKKMTISLDADKCTLVYDSGICNVRRGKRHFNLDKSYERAFKCFVYCLGHGIVDCRRNADIKDAFHYDPLTLRAFHNLIASC